jgi:hypothetical protein
MSNVRVLVSGQKEIKSCIIIRPHVPCLGQMGELMRNIRK